jgi:hypothetical protein
VLQHVYHPATRSKTRERTRSSDQICHQCDAHICTERK